MALLKSLLLGITSRLDFRSFSFQFFFQLSVEKILSISFYSFTKTKHESLQGIVSRFLRRPITFLWTAKEISERPLQLQNVNTWYISLRTSLDKFLGIFLPSLAKKRHSTAIFKKIVKVTVMPDLAILILQCARTEKLKNKWNHGYRRTLPL